jgi:hypothetical protein
MKVIGAGLPRTGTLSTRAALLPLGFRTYHMEEVIMNHLRGDTDKWNALFEGCVGYLVYPKQEWETYDQMVRKEIKSE